MNENEIAIALCGRFREITAEAVSCKDMERKKNASTQSHALLDGWMDVTGSLRRGHDVHIRQAPPRRKPQLAMSSKFCEIHNTSKKMYKKHNKYPYYICLKCQSEKAVAWAKNNPERRKISNKRYSLTPLGKQNLYRNTLSHRKRWPEKSRAHWAVKRALKRGDLIKQPCVICGSVESQAHHEDYSKQLQVIWFCDFHHKQHHKKIRFADGVGL